MLDSVTCRCAPPQSTFSQQNKKTRTSTLLARPACLDEGIARSLPVAPAHPRRMEPSAQDAGTRPCPWPLLQVPIYPERVVVMEVSNVRVTEGWVAGSRWTGREGAALRASSPRILQASSTGRTGLSRRDGTRSVPRCKDPRPRGMLGQFCFARHEDHACREQGEASSRVLSRSLAQQPAHHHDAVHSVLLQPLARLGSWDDENRLNVTWTVHLDVPLLTHMHFLLGLSGRQAGQVSLVHPSTLYDKRSRGPSCICLYGVTTGRCIATRKSVPGGKAHF